MQRFLQSLMLVTCLCVMASLSGCGGPQDGEMENFDPAVSEQKSKEYAEQQKAGIEAAMKGGRGGRGGKK